MNIIFLTTLNPNDINSWSGTTFHLFHALSKKHNLKVIGQYVLLQAAYYVKNNFSKECSFENYIPILGSLCSEQIRQISNCDLVFFGDLYLAPFLEIDIPIVHLSDVNYHLFKDYLNPNNDEVKIRKLEKLEKKLLNKYTTIIYSSEWARQKTINYYSVNPDKIHVIEFGANIPTPTNYTINVDTRVCNLVFIGKNWQKKGGRKALEAYQKLKAENFPCTLTIIGSAPDVLQEEDKNLKIFPFLDKSNSAHLKKLCTILSEAHFLVLPTEFDAYGIVFCEASAYAVPSIAANVGGVSQPISEGKNGYLLSPDATAEDYAEKIRTVFNDKEYYLKLRTSSRHEFETRLNWDVWSERVNTVLEETVRNYKKGNKTKV
nr:glycosyltransferase family 4 protein [uncultured Bacteroides sp.]